MAGALHEVAAERDDDMAAAFGFVAALLGRMPSGASSSGASPSGASSSSSAPLLLVSSPRGLADYGRPHGHGLAELAIGRDLDLKASRRLHLAAGSSGVPLFLLRPAAMTGSSAAATRWRVGAAKAERDRFGLFGRRRWHLRLERCRNGQIGEWLVEWDHAAFRFSLSAPMADPAASRGASA